VGEFSNKVIFITGGTSGIGRGTAIEFAKAGAKVAFTGRRETEGNETLKLIEAAGGKGLFIKSDVGVPADIDKAVKTTAKELGSIVIAFNNAGIEEQPIPFLDQKIEVFDQIMQINVKGVWLCMQAQIKHMLEHGKGGSIINNASIAGLLGVPGVACYVASKHAVIGISKSVAVEFAKRNIRVNVVAPGPIQTEMWDRFAGAGVGDSFINTLPMARVGKAEEVASAVMWFASKGSSYTTGQVVAIDGGYTSV
jgi:NAD(P)-dependent dehydrogenase (short-subunit alcohol dehydrogenase family)